MAGLGLSSATLFKTASNQRQAKTKKTARRRVFWVAEPLIAFSVTLYGSTTWTRTRDPVINSHLLYQLSYRGMRRILLIGKEKSSAISDFLSVLGVSIVESAAVKGQSAVGGYQNGGSGLPWRPGSGFTRCRPQAAKVRFMTRFMVSPVAPAISCVLSEVFA